MPVARRFFGTTQQGETVSAWQLSHHTGASVTVLDYGAAVQSLCVPDRAGRLTDVVLGYDTAAAYETNDGHLGATVGRMCNRIGGAAFSLNGKTYPLERNDGVNHLHGGRRGFDRYLWQAEPGEDSLRFSRVSPDGEADYPGRVTVSVTFHFTEENRLVIAYDAVSDADTVINLTNHSYFNLNGGGTVLDHRLQVFAARLTENDGASVPTGRFLDVAGTPFDFRRPKAIGRDIGSDHPQMQRGHGYDHNFVLSGPQAAFLYSQESGIALRVFTTLPGMQVYTANYLSERVGKGGRVMRPRDAVCLETQLFPDGMAHYGFPSPVLRAGEQLHTETHFAFSVE